MLLLINGLGQWLRGVAEGLQRFIVEVPIYVAAPAMVIIGALDSSLLSLPEINDYLVVMRCYSDPKAAFYFPLFAALGSVIGCTFLYALMRRGGQAVLRRRFSDENIARVERAYARFGFLTLAVPALLPPPMPFKIFVATAGALEYPRWRFMITIMIARSVRYYVEGILAVYYGRQVLRFIEQYGLKMLGAVAALCLCGLAIYFVIKNVKAGQVLNPVVRAIGVSVIGLVAGGFVGFLLRPTIPLIGKQLPFITVIQQGANLESGAPMLIPFAQTSFNYLLAGALAGALLGIAIAYLSSKKEFVQKQPNAE